MVAIGADGHLVPTYARCPECHAALPPGAPWCSLCHADLRPPSTRVVAPTVPDLSDELVTATARAGDGGRHSLPEGDDGSAAHPAPVRGRHRRPEPDDAAGSTDDGDPAQLRTDVDALVAEAPRDAEGRPDVEVLTAQLMARLASSEGRRARSGVPHIDNVPGGKWGVMIGGMLAMAVVLVIAFGVIGSLVMR